MYLFFIKKLAWPDRSFIKLQLVLGLLLISGGNGLGIYGLQYIDSGISAILATFSPILIAFYYPYFKRTSYFKMDMAGIGFRLLWNPDNMFAKNRNASRESFYNWNRIYHAFNYNMGIWICLQ